MSTADAKSDRKTHRARRSVVFAAAVCVIVWLGFVAYVDWAMRQPPEVFGGVMARMPMPAFFVLPFETLWNRTRAGNLQAGDQAPAFTLKELQGGEGSVDMATLWNKRPVVLVFGSYTWPPFRREVPALNKLADQYRGKVDFYAVYILEAHPTDVWQMQSNVREGVLFRDPRTEAERSGVANACWRKLGIHFPALLDSIDNHVEAAYTGWPDRLYLVDRGGRVLYKSRPGPFGFHADELGEAIRGSVH